jgi:hypothetical protein
MAERLVVNLREPKDVEVIFVVHLYYVEMLYDLGQHISRLRAHFDFEMIVTIPQEHEYKALVNSISKTLDPFMVISMDNKGKDVLPFLNVLKYIRGFKYGCKIHTKNISQDAGLGTNENNLYDNWRDDIWHSLMDSNMALEALDKLRDGTKVYAPNSLWLNDISNSKHFSDTNIKNQKLLGEKVGIELSPKPFIAGTMFWFDVSSLLWLGEFDWEDLFNGYEASDGQMEHAFERSFAQLGKEEYVEEESKIYTLMPYKDGDKSFVDTCNRFMDLIPDDNDFGLLIDHDAIFTTPDWHKQLQDAIKRYPDINVFGCMTNRIYSPCLWAEVDRDSNDMFYHREMGKNLAHEYWDEAFEFPCLDDKNKGLGGFFIMMRKSTWKRIGGFTCTLKGDKEACHGMDWALTHRLLDYNEKIYILKGVYMYHWYSNFNPENYDKGLKREVDFSHHGLFPPKIAV